MRLYNHISEDFATQRACGNTHVVQMIISVQQIKREIPVLLDTIDMAIRCVRTNDVSTGNRFVVENLRTDVLEMPINNQIRRRNLRHGIPVEGNSKGPAPELIIESGRKYLIASAELSKIVRFFDVPTLFFKVQHCKAVDGSTKGMPGGPNYGTRWKAQTCQSFLHAPP